MVATTIKRGMNPATPVAAGAVKLPFIESLRGLAACQVLLLHYCAAFLPVLARVPGPSHFDAEAMLSHTPVFTLMDGYSAVYLFFVMSGFVLAPSFLRARQGVPLQVSKRFVRLSLPVLAAFCCAVLLRLALPHGRDAALEFSHSGWLQAMGHNPMTWQALLSDGLWNAMLAGYQGFSVFSPWPALADALRLTPVGTAINSPMWTLHVEFWGSLLLIAVAYCCRRLPAPLFWTLFVALAWLAGSGHFQLFLAGFLLYRGHEVLLRQPHWLVALAGAALALAGLCISTSKQVPLLSAAWQSFGGFGLLRAGSDFHWQSQVGALLLFCGVLLCAPLRQLLDNRLTLWLGRLSFSIYLLHFPILLTVGSSVFALLAPLSYGMACAGALLAGGAATLCAAVYFERWADRPAVALSRRIGAQAALA